MLVFNHSLLNREYTLIDVLKTLISIISKCGLHVIFLSNITPRYFTLFTNGMFRPFNVRRDSDGLSRNQSQVKVKVTLRLTVSQSVSPGVEPQPEIYYSSTVTVLFLWGVLSDERTGLSFVYAAGPRQRSLSRVRVPWHS
jgi:hypothetical protein